MNNELTYKRETASVDETKQLAQTLAAHLRADDVILLRGDLGAGKTQFVQGVASALGVTAPVTSPTFNILLSYDEGRLVLNHFDLYRLDEPEELYDIDFDGTLESGGVSFVEWGDKFIDAMPYSYLDIEICTEDAQRRTVFARAVGDCAGQLLASWAADPASGLELCTR